ncbi:hypothetical protein FRC05_005662 [Tulasnella sp. 425]|nr:hypothetical protein FRC05_005662 [Tulasnella sp. 425]
MRLSTLFAASFVSFAAAAAFTDIPACALGCLLLTINDSGSCILTDQACLCQDQAFLAASTACIQTSCSAEDDAKAAEIYDELCAAVGVTQTFTPTTAASETASVAASTAGPSQTAAADTSA